jgi:hypothetical protein
MPRLFICSVAAFFVVGFSLGLFGFTVAMVDFFGWQWAAGIWAAMVAIAAALYFSPIGIDRDDPAALVDGAPADDRADQHRGG